jgi:hypothetical protein
MGELSSYGPDMVAAPKPRVSQAMATAGNGGEEGVEDVIPSPPEAGPQSPGGMRMRGEFAAVAGLVSVLSLTSRASAPPSRAAAFDPPLTAGMARTIGSIRAVSARLPLAS